MKSKNELKEIDIKNRMCYLFDDIITDRDIYSVDILSDKKYITVYDLSYKTSTVPKPLRIGFNKLDEFTRLCGSEFNHLVLFNNELFDKICDKVKYLISEKSGITDSIIHNFGEIRIDS